MGGLPSELGIAIASGLVPASGSPPSGWRAGLVSRRQGSHETTLRQPPRVPAECAGRETVRGDNDSSVFRRLRELRVADGCQRQVAEHAGAIPALIAGLGVQAHRPCVRLQVGQRFEPVDPCEPVSELAARLGVEKMSSEGRGVRLGEPQGGDAFLRQHAYGLPRPRPAPSTSGIPSSTGRSRGTDG